MSSADVRARSNDDDDEGADGNAFCAWRVLEAIDCSIAKADGTSEGTSRRTLKVRATTGTRDVAVVEGERWSSIATVDALIPGSEIAIRERSLGRASDRAVVVVGDGDVVALGGRVAELAEASSRERRAREAAREAADGASTSKISTNAPKFVEFDPSKPVEVRSRLTTAGASVAARRLAETNLEAPTRPATMSTRPSITSRCANTHDGPPRAVASKSSTEDPPPPVRAKPKLPPGRRAHASSSAPP